MTINKLTVSSPLYTSRLRRLAQPPAQLFTVGADLTELLNTLAVAIVGSRSISPYGRQITRRLAGELAEQGITIISGLALGVDGQAHEAALEAGGRCIAVLPSPIEAIVPTIHRRLADRILEQGGALVSEYPAGTHPVKQYFIARNRIVAGLADALLITEAAEKSGSLHTARFALEQGTDVLAVPGNITSLGSVGTNNLIKSGATPVTSYRDVLYALGIDSTQIAPANVKGRNSHEQTILDLLQTGITQGEALLRESRLAIKAFNQAMAMLEISGKIRPLGANQWSV